MAKPPPWGLGEGVPPRCECNEAPRTPSPPPHPCCPVGEAGRLTGGGETGLRGGLAILTAVPRGQARTPLRVTHLSSCFPTVCPLARPPISLPPAHARPGRHAQRRRARWRTWASPAPGSHTVMQETKCLKPRTGTKTIPNKTWLRLRVFSFYFILLGSDVDPTALPWRPDTRVPTAWTRPRAHRALNSSQVQKAQTAQYQEQLFINPRGRKPRQSVRREEAEAEGAWGEGQHAGSIHAVVHPRVLGKKNHLTPI